MSLELIIGPPNSGRAGEILERFVGAVEADPLLVVPTRDDVDRFERELCKRRGAALGGSVTSFPGLFAEVADVLGVIEPTPLSRIQRIWLARAATERPELRLLAGSARSRGFAPALEGLIGDLQSAGLDSEAFADKVAGAEDSSAYEREIAALFGAYERLRDRLGRGDEHLLAARATAALRADPAGWGRRPVLLYGFDDLAREQIELVAALAEATDVSFALAYEDRQALAARAELLGVLRDELGGEIVAKLAASRAHTASATLFHLERRLFEPEAPAAPSDGSLQLLEAAGERGEAELIGRRVAELIASGEDPDAIAIAVRSPDRQAPLLARVLGSLGIPTAAEAQLPLARTATGSALLRLLAIAGPDGGALDVVAFLRGPARAPADSVDWLERTVRRKRLATADEALEAWRGSFDRRIWALDDLTDAGDDGSAVAAALARIASDLAERPYLREGTVPETGPAVELRAAAEVRRALGEVAELGRLAAGPTETEELLAHLRVPLWRGPTEGRVRILSPYRLRAGRVRHLFVAGLTDGRFPAAGAAEPLLSEERRRALALPARRDPAAEERYLFYACVSRPERSLALAYPTSDESGATLARSPFVDEVRALLDPPPTPDPGDDVLEREIAVRADVGQIAPRPEHASSPRALARALAALDPDHAIARAERLELPAEVRTRALEQVADARERVAASLRPGPLRSEAALASLSRQDLFGASTLEEYDTCSYRWFVRHELAPQSIDPDPDPLEHGGIMHVALERLYGEPPAGDRPETSRLHRWQQAAHERLREAAAERGWDLDSGRARIALARFDALVDRFLAREAETGGPLRPDPALLEAAFGDRPDDRYPAAEIAGFRLHGRIDRVDVSPGGQALIRDYKLSSKAVAAKRLLAEGRLQLPLYMAVAREIGLEPVGGLYHPLAAGGDDRPRGLLAKEHKGSLIPGETEAHVGTDFLEPDEFDELIEAGVERAGEIVAAIRTGQIGRDPRDGRCPPWCDYAPVCRIERGVAEVEEER